MGIDPGTTTGIARINFQENHGYCTLVKQLPALEAMYYIEERIKWPFVTDQIVIEDYLIVGQSGAGNYKDPLHVIGVTKFLADKTDTDLVIQASASRKAGMSIAEKLGLLTKGQRHSNDALAHALSRILDIKSVAPIWVKDIVRNSLREKERE